MKQKLIQNPIYLLAITAILFGVLATINSFIYSFIITYGDAESHLNISKKVVDGLTPGFSQLGGIWLPIPHLLMTPFVYFDPLWRTGLAGSIVSGIAFVISTIFVYKTAFLLTNHKIAAIFTSLIFMLNPNVLYLQSTPMTEIPLIMFLLISTYCFFKFLKNDQEIPYLILAGLFGFLATLSRYDGWFLVALEALILVLYYVNKFFKDVYGQKNSPKKNTKEIFKKYLEVIEGKVILFSTIAFFGILIWLAWDFLILGDPFYFTNSQFSAKSQQMMWHSRGELPAYHNIGTAISYYLVTAMQNFGVLLTTISVVGFFAYAFMAKGESKFFYLSLLLVPFIFNILTLFLGQSVIFIPSLTPSNFEWNLFNVRYGVMAIPTMAIFIGWLFARTPNYVKAGLIIMLIAQSSTFATGIERVISWEDGNSGLSRAKRPDSEVWLAKNYDNGLVLIDDYARSTSIIRSGIPMNQVIYIGSKPYWDESLEKPQIHAEWVITQKDDAIWDELIDNPIKQAELYKYYNKVYTSEEILIFKRNPSVVVYK